MRNASTIGASVFSHSGEFAPAYTDLQLKGRGLDLQLIRSYRSSLAGKIGDLGRGWSSSIAKKIEREGDRINYHDGAGEIYTFLRGKDGNYASPTGFYGILLQEKKQFLIHQRYGQRYRFERPERGGKIVSIEDRNHNIIRFSYSGDRIVIVDTLGRKITISINNGRMQELKDHAGRTWNYNYNNANCLIEVTQPRTSDFPDGTSIKYAYDTSHRLLSVTDGKGQKYLINSYDTSGRIVSQKHGSGVFKMEYDRIGTTCDGFPIYRTTCVRKNGSKLALDHNDAGNVILRRLLVRKDSFAPADRTNVSGNNIPLITKSTYSKNSELTTRLFPAGNKTEWVYAENETNPLDQGNLLQITDIPQRGVKSDQSRIIAKYEYEPKLQLITKHTDPRGSETSYDYDGNGNLIVTTYPLVTIQPVNEGAPRPAPATRIQKTECRYSSMGQLLEKTHIDGAITEYHYYPLADPTGKRGPNSAINSPDGAYGYLARVVRDAKGNRIKNEYAYDDIGNTSTIWDGKSNPVRIRYNAMGKIENVTGRKPSRNEIDYKYDANYNEVESVQSFDRFEYDEATQATIVKSSILRELKEYNALDNVTRRKLIGDDKVITEFVIRDADENIIRQIQPLGNTTDYVYDERNLLLEKRFGVGTKGSFLERFTYTRNGAVRTYTDGNGGKTMYHYDGFQRHKGFTNAVGTRWSRWFDEADNVVRIEIADDSGLTTKKSKVGQRGKVPLTAAQCHFDEWNRVYRVDQRWFNLSNGDKLGESKWNGEKGMVSMVLEYAENGLLGKMWTETENVLAVDYDGIGRAIRAYDLTGEQLFLDYDENNNPVLLKYLGPEVKGRRCERVIRRRHDEMDRLVWQQEGDEAPEQFAYNALGNVINHIGKSGVEIRYTDDALSRRVGHAFVINDPLDDNKAQKMVRRFEYDDNYRLSAYTDAAGKRAIYRYDALDRRTGTVFPDGSAGNVDYDAVGNIVRVVDQNGNKIINRYDAANRLVERRNMINRTGEKTVEQFEYDGVNRLLAAISPEARIRRSYDSLSRLVTEQQGNHELRGTHDSAGNLTSLVYPGGETVHKEYDIRNRVTSVKNKSGEVIASFSYRANNQIATMLLGNRIETDFFYNLQERLEAVKCKRRDTQKLIEGFRYQYDDTGKIVSEVQLRESSTFGERYYYDSANRPVKVQYGVQNVFDPNSSFDQETSYEHFPEGPWKRRTDVDGHGQILQDKIGTINELSRYRDFGPFSFEYDANGNCLRKGKSNPGYFVLTYDQNNNLVRSEYYSFQGKKRIKTQTIEYFYDSFGRLVRKAVTDKNGQVIEYTYVYRGFFLLEEYENGVLVRTYLYGGSMPVQLTLYTGGLQFKYYYTYNGKALATGLLNEIDPYAFAETYRWEFTGACSIREIGGVLVAIPSSSSDASKLDNSLWSGNGFTITDRLNGTFSENGRHMDRTIGAGLSSNSALGGGVHIGGGGSGIAGAGLGDFLNILGLAGLGSTRVPPPGVQTSSRAPNWSLYGGQSDGGSQPPIHDPTPAEKAQQVADKASGQLAVTFGGLAATIKGGPVAFYIGLNVALGKAYGDVQGNLQELARIQKEADAQRAAAKEKAASDAAARAAREEQEERERTPSTSNSSPAGDYPAPDPDTGTAYVDPDSAGNAGSFQLPSPGQIEARLMQNKTPVNPNDGFGPVWIDPSPPPRQPGAIDPTIALYDGESGGIIDGDINILIGGGYTDFVQGFQGAPEIDPSRSGGKNPIALYGRSFP